MNDTINLQQPNSLKPDCNNINRLVPIIFLLFILFFAAWIRFDRITEQWGYGRENFRYIAEAKLWVEGPPQQFVNGRFYRPAAYALILC